MRPLRLGWDDKDKRYTRFANWFKLGAGLAFEYHPSSSMW